MKMTKEIQAFAVNAYRAMKDTDGEEHPTRAYFDSRQDHPEYLDYLMLRRHWYYGDWVFFETGLYGCKFDASYLAELVAAEDAAKERKTHTVVLTA